MEMAGEKKLKITKKQDEGSILRCKIRMTGKY